MALAYGDAHVEVDEGRVMLRPRDFAKLVDAADIRPSDVVLDVACGRGYSTAIMARLADTVVGLETSDEPPSSKVTSKRGRPSMALIMLSL